MDEGVESIYQSIKLQEHKQNGTTTDGYSSKGKKSGSSSNLSPPIDGHRALKRNIIAFWIFGVGTNFPFILSLSAAEDILNSAETSGANLTLTETYRTSSTPGNGTGDEFLKCTPTSTGVILLCAILPDLCVKMVIGCTTKQLPYNVKVLMTAIFMMLSFLILAFANTIWLNILGVVFASLGSGLGEITFMALSCFYHRDVVSGWSSGTGASGIFASVIYAGFTSMGISSTIVMLVVLVVPFGLLATYALMLKPEDLLDVVVDTETTPLIVKEKRNMTFREKMKSIPHMLSYLIPLLAVYFGVYFVLQGLIQLLYFNDSIMSKQEQYRWYQVIYRIGAFISRSSVNLFQVKKLYLLPFIPFVNIALLVFQIYFRFIPNVWIVMALVFLDGFIQGISYVNTFYCITTQLKPEEKEFALGLATASRPLGIVIAGGLSLPVHEYICSLKLKM